MALKVQNFDGFEQANKIFTDREEPRKAFWDIYDKCKVKLQLGEENDISVLTYYGIGGIGKTTLLNKLQQELDEYKKTQDKKSIIPYVYYDMKTDTSKRSILESLKKVLNKNYGFDFPIFDLALNIYLLKIGKAHITSKHEGFVSGNQYVSVATDIASAGIDFLNIVPLAGPLAAGSIKIIDKLIANQRNINANRKIELSKLQNNSPEEILNNLQLYFAKDLADNLKEAKYPLVIFFDTYEMLVNELASVGEPLLNDNWLRDLKNGLITHTPNTIWVIGGRDIIKWDNINSEWNENLEQHLVGNLSEVDTKQFLIESGINDLKIQEQIYQITNGIPVYLDICKENYFYLINTGKEPSGELLGKDENELIERFMRYADDNQKDIIYLLSCLDEWTEEELYSIASLIFNSISISTVKKIKGLSFVESCDGINFRVHKLVKDVLYNNCFTEIKQKAAKYIENNLKEKIDNTEQTAGIYVNLLKKYILNRLKQIDKNFEPYDCYNEIYKKYIFPLNDNFQYNDVSMLIEIFVQHFQLSNVRSFFTARLYSDYSKSLREAGKYKDMVFYAETAYDIYAENAANNLDIESVSIDILNCCKNLAAIYYKSERYNEAIGMQENLLRYLLDNQGGEHLDTIMSSMGDLSVYYSAAGRNGEATKIAKQVLEHYETTLGNEHLDTIIAMNNLSMCYIKDERINEAAKILEKATEICSKVLGDENPTTIMNMNNLSVCYYKLGRRKDAEEIAEKVLALNKKILGEDHPNTLASMKNLSDCYGAVGKSKEALEIAEKIVELKIKILGDRHPDTINAMVDLSVNYGKAGRDRESIDIAEKALELSKNIFGNQHLQTVKSMRNLVICYNKVKRYEEAIEVSQKIVELYKRTIGDKELDTIKAMNRLSSIYGLAGRNNEAKELSEKVLEHCNKILGKEHPVTKEALIVYLLSHKD